MLRSKQQSIRRYCPEWYYSWLDDDSSQNKIILKADSEAKLQALSRDAFAQGDNPAKIYDAGGIFNYFRRYEQEDEMESKSWSKNNG
jgi:peptidyl-tRNA hydrolase